MIISSSQAVAAGGPTVDENTGKLKYTYTIELPPARGRYQPRLTLEYNDKGGADVVAGGWSLGGHGSIKTETQDASGASIPRRHLYVVDGTPKLLVPAAPPRSGYAVDVEQAYMQFQPNEQNWEGVDAAGNTYLYAWEIGSRLTQVVDADGNCAVYSYSRGPVNYGLEAIFYNAYSVPASSEPKSCAGPFATVVSLEYAYADTDTLRLLRNIRVQNQTASGLVTVRRYALGYAIDQRWVGPTPEQGVSYSALLASVTEFGGENGPSRVTTFQSAADPAGTELFNIVEPHGARWDVDWEIDPATDGLPTDPPSLHYGRVRSVTRSGPALKTHTTQYWYSTLFRGLLWHDLAAEDTRGYTESWTYNATTGVVKHAWWESTAAFKGEERAVEWGTVVTPGSDTQPPTYAVFRRQVFKNSSRVLSAAGVCSAVKSDGSGFFASTDVAAAQYPILPFTASVEDTSIVDGLALTSMRTVACADVDSWGNVTKLTVDPDVRAPQDQYTEGFTYVVGSTPTASCKDCVSARTLRRGSDGALLEQTSFAYDPTYKLLGTAALAAAGGPAIATSAWTYHPDGNVRTETRDGVRTTYAAYDSYQLRPTRVEAADSVSAQYAALVTETQYDDFGRPGTMTGPYVLGQNGPRRQRAMAYDDLGRVTLIANSPISGAVASGALAAFEYVQYDPATPAALTTTRAYQFSVPKTFDRTTGVPPSSDVKLALSYFDGLGREVQVRERLGGDVASTDETAAHISERLSAAQYRVSKALVLDAVGRLVASVEPYYSDSGTFVDLSTFPVDKRSGTVRATLNTYDALGRTTCTAERYVETSVSAAALTSCVSSLALTTGYARATAYRYRGVTDSGTGRNFVGVKTVLPENNTGGASPGEEAFHAPNGTVEWIVDVEGSLTRYVRDLLGRETEVWREVASGAKPAIKTKVVLDLMGRVAQRIDPNIGRRRLEYSPDAPALVAKVVFEQSGQEIRYTHDKGRVRETCTAANATAPCVVDSTLEYDLPHGTSGYDFTAGRVSRAWNGNTLVAFGYDDSGNVVRRDQWLAGVPAGWAPGAATSATYAFSATATVNASGQPLDSSFRTPVTSFSTASYYDSAGRPVTVSGAGTTYWQATTVPGTGAYDALGRLGGVDLDDGRVKQSWSFGETNGLLASYGVAIVGDAAPVVSVVGMTYTGARLKSWTDAVSGTSNQYWYSVAGRLTAAKATPSAAPAAVMCYGHSVAGKFGPGPTFGNLEIARQSSVTHDYVYSGAGIEGSVPTGMLTAAGPDAPSAIASAPGTQDRLAYDALGRITAAGGAAYRYDLLGRLEWFRTASGEEETLRYDPFGALLSRQVGAQVTAYVGSHATVVGTLRSGCQTQACGVEIASVDSHVAVGGMRVASVRAGPSAFARTIYLHRDRLRSVVATTLAGGMRGAGYRYGPYGAMEAVSGETPDSKSELGYTGGVRLSGGLVVMGVRVYNPALRTFLQPDPLVPFKYDYADGDPINRWDPLGFQSVGTEDVDAQTYGETTPKGVDNAPTTPPIVCPDGSINGCTETIEVSGKWKPGAGAYWMSRFGFQQAVLRGTLATAPLGASAVGNAARALLSEGARAGTQWLRQHPATTRVAAKVVAGVAAAIVVAALVGTPAGWGALAIYAVAGASTSVLAGVVVANFVGDDYSDTELVTDAVTGAIGLLVPGAATISAVKAAGGQALTKQVASQLMWGEMLWGVEYGAAVGALPGP
jgi:RHS repeat-associated protein